MMSLSYETGICSKLNFLLIAFVGAFEIPSLLPPSIILVMHMIPESFSASKTIVRPFLSYETPELFWIVSFQNGLKQAPFSWLDWEVSIGFLLVDIRCGKNRFSSHLNRRENTQLSNAPSKGSLLHLFFASLLLWLEMNDH